MNLNPVPEPPRPTPQAAPVEPPSRAQTAISGEQATIGKGLVMYMQMGGNPGDGATLARQTGAAQAAPSILLR